MINKLYHFTDLSSLFNIIQSNTLQSFAVIAPSELRDYYFKSFISLTRDKRFIWRGNVRIVLNKDLLKNNYKIIPFNHFGNLSNDAKTLYLKYTNLVSLDQQEEIVITRQIEDITKYIIDVDLHSLKDLNYKEIVHLISEYYNINKINLYSDYLKTKIHI